MNIGWMFYAIVLRVIENILDKIDLKKEKKEREKYNKKIDKFLIGEYHW